MFTTHGRAQHAVPDGKTNRIKLDLLLKCLSFILPAHCAVPNAAVHTLRRPALPSMNSHMSSSPQKDSSYVLKLKNNGNVEYFGDFTIGNQVLPAIYDTGSFEVLTISTLCESCDRDGAVYDRKASKTFHSGSAIEAVHQFGSGPVLGRKGEETVHIGNSESPLMVESMPFWEVIKHGISAWETSKFVAIIGLGPKDTAPKMKDLEPEEGEEGKKEIKSDDTLLHRLGLDEFSMCLGRGNFAPGLLGFGSDIVSMKRQDFFTPIPVVGKVHWGVEMTKWGPGDFDPCDPSCGAVIDSGTTFISVSPKALKAMALTGLSDQIRHDCSNVDELPDLSFDLGGQHFTLPPAAYVMEVSLGEARQISLLEKGIQKKIKKLRGQGLATACVAAFQEIDHETQYGPMMILGMPFLRYYYTIFDRGEKKIYTAPSSKSCSPLKGKSQGFVLQNRFQKKDNATTSGHRRSSLDVRPTPVDLRHARFEPGLLRPGMPYRIEL